MHSNCREVALLRLTEKPERSTKPAQCKPRTTQTQIYIFKLHQITTKTPLHLSSTFPPPPLSITSFSVSETLWFHKMGPPPATNTSKLPYINDEKPQNRQPQRSIKPLKTKKLRQPTAYCPAIPDEFPRARVHSHLRFLEASSGSHPGFT